MLTLEECRRIDPRLSNLSDEELLKVKDELYNLAQIALDSYFEKAKTKTS